MLVACYDTRLRNGKCSCRELWMWEMEAFPFVLWTTSSQGWVSANQIKCCSGHGHLLLS
jgi:hypothetical protein